MAEKNQFAELLKKPAPLAPADCAQGGNTRSAQGGGWWAGRISAATSIQR